MKLLNSGPSLRTLDLSRFPFLGHKSCRAGGVRNYAIAWSLVHFLRHSGEEGLEIFDKLFAELLVGTDNRTAIERAFTGHDLDRLERELLLYVADLAQ